ncbi:hypothetical protein [Roseomonas sp. CECT 9278]|uniref:hypothetical protein n=1 Tax=Roseomonas sp. CECT 9278 TaxID=2845823 RepID=UPI001E2DA0EE|nr:hypothetical protein [Roseomonas sp. CECT 9278]CAH0288697.1 hypothetical protein ROS9278_04164 [Roseomonas sp. CECT 9278]
MRRTLLCLTLAAVLPVVPAALPPGMARAQTIETPAPPPSTPMPRPPRSCTPAPPTT